MKINSSKSFLKRIAAIFVFIILSSCIVIYLSCNIYDFRTPATFSGNFLYNPYKFEKLNPLLSESLILILLLIFFTAQSIVTLHCFKFLNHKLFKMKSNKLIWLIWYSVCFAACNKQVDTSIENSNATRLNAQTFSQEDLGIGEIIFVSGIDNPYLPLKLGTVFYYRNTIIDKGGISYEDDYVTVTKDIKTILGVGCEVVHDQVKENGKVTEDTYDWYAQDRLGNVWYFGEATLAQTDHGWSSQGSWQAGVNGAKPGIVMFAHPGLFVGTAYYQEFEQGIAEDEAINLNINSSVHVPYGSFNDCLETKEFTKLSPGDIEHKFYAQGVGEILTKAKGERDELISVTHN